MIEEWRPIEGYEDKRLVILMSLYAILHKYYIQII